MNSARHCSQVQAVVNHAGGSCCQVLRNIFLTNSVSDKKNPPEDEPNCFYFHIEIHGYVFIDFKNNIYKFVLALSKAFP